MSQNPMHAALKLAHLSAQFPGMDTTAWLNGSGLDAQKLELMMKMQQQQQQQQQQAELSQMGSGRPPFPQSMSQQQQSMHHAMQNGHHGLQASPLIGSASPSATNPTRRQSQSSMHNQLSSSQSSSQPQPTPSHQELQQAQAMLNHFTGGQSVHIPNISPKSSDDSQQRFPFPSGSLRREELAMKQEMSMKQQQSKPGGLPSGSMGSNVFMNVSQPPSPGMSQFNAQDLSMFNTNPVHAMAEQRERLMQAQQSQMINQNQQHLPPRQTSQPAQALQMQPQGLRSQSVAMPPNQPSSHSSQAQALHAQAQQSRFSGSSSNQSLVPGLPPNNLPPAFDSRSHHSDYSNRGGQNSMSNSLTMALAMQQQQQAQLQHNQSQSSHASMQHSGYGNNLQLPTTPSSQSNFLPPQPSVIHSVRQNSASSAHSMPVNAQSVRHRGGQTPQGMPNAPGTGAMPMPGQSGMSQMNSMSSHPTSDQNGQQYPDFFTMKAELTDLTRRLDVQYRDYHATQRDLIDRLCMFGHCMSVVAGRNNPAVTVSNTMATRADDHLRLFQQQHLLTQSRASAALGSGRMQQSQPQQAQSAQQQQSQSQSHASMQMMNNLGNMNMSGQAESMYSPSTVSNSSASAAPNVAVNSFQTMLNLAQSVSMQQQINNNLPLNQQMQQLQQSQQHLLSQISPPVAPAAALVLSEPADSTDSSTKAKRRVPSKKDDAKGDKPTKAKSASGSNKDRDAANGKASSSSTSRNLKDREKKSESGKERDSPKKANGSKSSSTAGASKGKTKKESKSKTELSAAPDLGSRQTSDGSTDEKPAKNDSSSASPDHITPIIAVPEGTLGLSSVLDESLHHSIVVKDSRVQSLPSSSLDHNDYEGLSSSLDSSYHHPHLSIRPYGSDFGTDYNHPASPSIGMMRPSSGIMDVHGFALHGMSGAGSPMPISPAAAEPRVGRLDLRRDLHDDDAMDTVSFHDDGDDGDRDDDDNEDDGNDVKSAQNESTSEEERLVASGGKLSRSYSTNTSHDSDLATTHSSLSSSGKAMNESRKRSSNNIRDDDIPADWLNNNKRPRPIHLSMN